MALIGSILGDIAGSQYEGERCPNPDKCSIFNEYCGFTDDTVASLAIKYSIINDIPFKNGLKHVCKQYPNCGYAGMFEKWVFSDDDSPYNSWGNGSAMRVSYIADKYSSLNEVQLKAKQSAESTHNHPEGIKGAVTTATCIWMAKNNKSKLDIYNYVLCQYPSSKYKYSIDTSIDYLIDKYEWDVSCQGSVPVAMRCFYESDSYESFIRNVFRLDCDSDTLCAIGGGVAEEFYKTTGFNNDKILKKYLDDYLLNILYEKGKD